MMLRQIKILIMVLITISFSIASQASDLDNFINSFKLAVKNNDIPTIDKMNHWSGIPERQREALIASFADLGKKGIVNVRVEHIENGKDIIFKNKYIPNLAPIAKIYLEINTNKSFRGGYSYYIGKEGNELKFSHIILKDQ